MNHEEWLEQAEIYALGALDGKELTEFEAHLASGCRLCEDHLRATRETLTALPRSLTPLDPPAAVKARLFQQLGAGTKEAVPARRQLRWAWWGVGASAFIAAGLLLVLSWNFTATRKQLRDLKAEISALEIQVAQREELIRFLSDPQVRVVNLAGLPPGSGARGKLLWNPLSRTGLLLATDLSPVPTDKIYELWGIAGAEPVPAGVFRVDQRGLALFRLPTLPKSKSFDKFAVTLEPAGGVPQPTGTMVLIGSL